MSYVADAFKEMMLYGSSYTTTGEDVPRYSISTDSTNSVFTTWNIDPDEYSLDQMCLFEEDDPWKRKRSRLMEWFDQQSDASFTTAARQGTTPSPRW